MRKLVFVGGFPSGGTDLLKNIMNAHPDVYINGEMPFLFRLDAYGVSESFQIKNVDDFNGINEIVDKYDIWENVENLKELNFEDVEGLTLEGFMYKAFHKSERKIWGNKTPQNTENIAQLIKHFPDSKFIIIIRDIRDVALSWSKKWGKNKFLTAHKWNHRVSNIHTHSNVLILKYEDLISQIEDCAKLICEFLNVDFSEQMLRYHEITDLKIDGKLNYGKKVIGDNKEKWKKSLSRSTVKRIEEIAYSGLIKHNYPIAFANKNKPLTKFENVIGKLHDILAVLFVGNRAKKDNSFGSRLREIKNQIMIRI